ncbi:MAG: glycosyltransferase family 2 protein [Candidatus Berkelbacteria bacterium]
MKISIVTPSYNQGQFIAETFDSILAQNFSNIEYIVTDGGSTDSTASVAKKYAPLFKKAGIDFKFISEKDKGQSDAINKGWKMATGDIITYLNSDDYYNKNVLKDVVNFFQKNPKIKWAYGGWNFVNKDGKLYRSVQPKEFSKNKLLDYCNIGQPSCFFRKTLLDEVGMLNVKLHLTMDYDLWLRFAKKYHAGIIDCIISNMRYYPDAKSGARTKEQLREVLKLSVKYTKLFSVRRFFQYFYYLRGLVMVLLRIDITKRINRS